MYDNFWIGDNELIITLVDDSTDKYSGYVVYERHEDYDDAVYYGDYAACRKYVENRWYEYQESIIG